MCAKPQNAHIALAPEQQETTPKGWPSQNNKDDSRMPEEHAVQRSIKDKQWNVSNTMLALKGQSSKNISRLEGYTQ